MILSNAHLHLVDLMTKKLSNSEFDHQKVANFEREMNFPVKDYWARVKKKVGLVTVNTHIFSWLT
jgi:hypothetical protein